MVDKLLFNLKFIEILKENQRLENSFSGSKYKVAILANITINQLKPIFELILRQEGVNAEVEIGNYNNIVQDSYSSDNNDAVIIFYDILNFFESNIFKLTSIDKKELIAIENRITNDIDIIYKNLSNCSNVLFNSFDVSLIANLSDSKSSFIDLVDRLNKYLIAKMPKNCFYVDTSFIIRKLGTLKSFSLSNFFLNKSLYSTEFLKEYAWETYPLITSNNGKSKKVLILDCDNTLWGGIIGEDGIDGISLGENSPKGSVYLSAHSLIKSIKDDGGLLAIVSKNNFSDVEHFFKNHKSTILKSNDFIEKQINWKNKVQNIVDISSKLNLGLESFVFLDDSMYEINMVKESLPEVTCFHVPENIFDYPRTLLEIKKLFYSPNTSSEDAKKTAYYLEESERKKSKSNFKDISDYLASLNLEITINWGKEIDIPRASQLTQKTNQFNLTTKRLTEIEIETMSEDKDYLIAMISLKDKFGDYGKTGLSIINTNKQKSVAEIDTFLLSCRILGRNVEFLFLDLIIKEVKRLGFSKVKSSYIPSQKNIQVADFYEKNSFRRIKNNTNGAYFQLNIDNYQNNNNTSFIKVHEK